MNTDKIASTHLGKKSAGSEVYDPSLLVAVPRTENREKYGIKVARQLGSYAAKNGDAEMQRGIEAKLNNDNNYASMHPSIYASNSILQPFNPSTDNPAPTLPLGEGNDTLPSPMGEGVRRTEGGIYKNYLEWAIIDDYEELQKIKKLYPKSMMSGSGSTYFIINDEFQTLEGYWVMNGLKAINTGVCVV